MQLYLDVRDPPRVVSTAWPDQPPFPGARQHHVPQADVDTLFTSATYMHIKQQIDDGDDTLSLSGIPRWDAVPYARFQRRRFWYDIGEEQGRFWVRYCVTEGPGRSGCPSDCPTSGGDGWTLSSVDRGHGIPSAPALALMMMPVPLSTAAVCHKRERYTQPLVPVDGGNAAEDDGPCPPPSVMRRRR